MTTTLVLFFYIKLFLIQMINNLTMLTEMINDLVTGYIGKFVSFQ